MDISQQFLIDMALNVGGYVLAGALGILMFSMFKRRKEVPVPVKSEPTPEMSAVSAGTQPVVTEQRRVEFVRLGQPNTARRSTVTKTAPVDTGNTGDRRDRAETIRIARTMLKAGASADKIKRVIPISDAELSLLSMSKS